VTEKAALGEPGRRIKTDQPHTARIWNYWLGGKDNYEVDQRAGDEIRRLHPGIGDYARADRKFLGRAVRHLAGERGIRQFLDIGTGLPTADNTHQVAQRVAPESRIVYVDNDPIVLSHAHALLGRGDGSTAYVQGDLRRPDEILERAAATLDLGKPVGLVLVGILHVIAEADRPHECVARLVDALAPGSYVAISHIVDRADEGDIRLLAERLNERMRDNYPATPRSPEDIRRFFDGLELVEPGLVPVPEWRPDGGAATRGRRATAILGGVARKP
jgi:hypothetical protein